MSDTPSSLYKYLAPKRALSVLEGLMIRFSQVSVLNDASEFSPPMLGIGDRSSIVDALRERFEKKYPGRLASYRNLLPEPEVERIVRESMVDSASKVEAGFESTREKIYQRLDENFGILSLSESPVQKLLWGHYADGDRGYLLEFNAAHPWFWQKREEKDGFRHLRPVKYVESREPKNLFDLTDDDVLYTKYRDWEYEKEWRIIQNFNAASVKMGPDDYGKDVLLFAIPPDCITGVVSGLRADKTFTPRLRGVVHSNSMLSHVAFSRIAERNGELEVVSDNAG
jgi:hypothetical protein